MNPNDRLMRLRRPKQVTDVDCLWAADEIERLRQELTMAHAVVQNRDAEIERLREDIEVWVKDCDKAEQEVERLRKALREIRGERSAR